MQTTFAFAQALFLFTGAIAIPAFGICGVILYAGEKPAGLPRFALCAGASAIGLGAGAVAAMIAFPEYPFSGPSEFVASLFVVPCHALGLASVVLLALRPSTVVQRIVPDVADEARAVSSSRWATGVGVWAAAIAATVILSRGMVMPQRLALPAEADQITEHLVGDSLLPDFTYTIEANMSPSAYRAYAAKLGLVVTNGDSYESAEDDCGTAASYDSGRMKLSAWCQ